MLPTSLYNPQNVQHMKNLKNIQQQLTREELKQVKGGGGPVVIGQCFLMIGCLVQCLVNGYGKAKCEAELCICFD